MSAYVKLMTPMTDQECLLAALGELGTPRVHDAPVQVGGRYQATITIDNRWGRTTGFLATKTGFQAVGYDLEQSWLGQVNARYQRHWQAKQERLAGEARRIAGEQERRGIEEERRRMEEERVRLVEAQRQAIHEKAKKMGYRVEEKREGEKLRLVLVKRTY